MSKKTQDIQFGKKKEAEVRPLLETFFGVALHKATLPNGDEDEFDRWDFLNDDETKRFELKGRRIKHNQYPTAVLNYSKIKNQDPSVDYTYIWNYTDGIYYLPYNEELWKTFKVKPMSVWRDGYCETQPCINVPHEHLVALTS